MNRFQFVADHRHAFEVKRLCEVLDVARSSFYAWDAAGPARAARAAADAALAARIRTIHATDRAQGAPRITAELNDGKLNDGKPNDGKLNDGVPPGGQHRVYLGNPQHRWQCRGSSDRQGPRVLRQLGRGDARFRYRLFCYDDFQGARFACQSVW